ncbi:MAG: hypothetical protein HY667_01815 [Chloroflexi bacterium]|nr:hypothetical protein [Chloroflexota bacterium]
MPRTIRKTTAKVRKVNRLADVPPDKRFYCNDGRIFNNLEDLASALKVMSDDTFRYHANESKNDFSNWISDVIGDGKLARDLRKVTSCVDAARIVADRVAYYKK